MGDTFRSGPEATEQVTADPFWSVVRRRHPELDIVLLPSEPPGPGGTPSGATPSGATPSGAGTPPASGGTPAGAATPPGATTPSDPPPLETLDIAEAADRFDAETEALWRLLLGDREPDERAHRWLHGPGDARRYEATWRLDEADPVTAVAAIDAAAVMLRQEGWRVLAPPDGMPRVLAGRQGPDGRSELQLVFAPAQGRLVLRLRTGAVRLADADPDTAPDAPADPDETDETGGADR